MEIRFIGALFLFFATNMSNALSSEYAREHLQRVTPGMSETSVRKVFSEVHCDEVRERLHHDRVNERTHDRLSLECIAHHLYSPYQVDFSPLSHGRKVQLIRYMWMDFRDADIIAAEVARTLNFQMVKKEWQKDTYGRPYPCWYFENRDVRSPLCHQNLDGFQVWHLGYIPNR